MSKNATTFERAMSVIPGGVNSPLRGLTSLDGEALFLQDGEGSHCTDLDGKEYLDLSMSGGPLILGHSHASVVRQVQAAAARGLSFGANHAGEIELAERILGPLTGRIKCDS